MPRCVFVVSVFFLKGSFWVDNHPDDFLSRWISLKVRDDAAKLRYATVATEATITKN